jgi:aryl-alcohol dehydrogenase-like predicted oxidoreductase
MRNQEFRDSLGSRLGRIGLGCATFGREIDAAAAFAVMDHAFHRGITHFDTAASYGDGVSERIVGDWIKSRSSARGSLLVATKMKPPYRPEPVERAISQSRQRLGLERIDLFYLHEWSEDLRDPRVLAVLDHAIHRGEIGAVGASNLSADQLALILQIQNEAGMASLRLLQNNHNFAVRNIDEKVQQLCAREQVSIVGYSPLGAGFLTAKHRHGVQPGSRFEVVPGHQNTYFTPAAWARLAHLESIAARTEETLPVLALAWAFNQPGIACTLIGARSLSHVDQALRALRLDTQGWVDELGAI